MYYDEDDLIQSITPNKYAMINNTQSGVIQEQEEKLSKLQIASKKIDRNAENIARRISREKTLEGVQDLTHLFNVAQAKKQVIRTLTYNQLLDSITEQMQERLTKRADQFSNKDLLDYAKVVSEGIDKAQKQIQSVDTTPMIQINQQNNTLVVDDGGLDRESRRKVIEAARAAMEYLQSQGIVVDDEHQMIEEKNDNYQKDFSKYDDLDDDQIVYNSDEYEDQESFSINHLYDEEEDDQ